MIYLDIAAAIASLANAAIALQQGQYGFTLGLLGGFGAWTILAAKEGRK